MAHLVTSVVDHYQDLLDNKSDPRVKGWAMMSSPVPTLLICLFYAYFSTVLGPKLMENRKPFNLRKILIFYNCVQTLFSAWICYEVSWTIRQNVLINKVSNYAFLVLNERLVGQLQLQVSTCRLFRQSHGPEDGKDVLVVLFFQIHRILRHVIFYFTQEK
jgi:hypothetical protein